MRQEISEESILHLVDGTAWMAMYCLDLLRIALELAREHAVYEDIATKFFEHFLHIAEAINRVEGEIRLWDEADAFFQDLLEVRERRKREDGSEFVATTDFIPMRVRSLVGLIPLCAVHVFDEESRRASPPSQHARAG